MKENNLLSGDIKHSLLRMSIPLMGISFVQLTYNLVDMFWLGKFSQDAVAAVGTAGLVSYIGNSIALAGRVGTATWVSQSYGRGREEEAVEFINNGLKLNLFLAIFYTIFAFIFMENFLNFFTLTDIVYEYAVDYLTIILIGMAIVFLNPMFAVSYNSIGNSMTPFKISIIGLITNIILDPLLIFKFNMGISGAALATVVAQIIVLLTYIFVSRSGGIIMSNVRIFSKINFNKIKRIFQTGWPAAVQSTVMASVSVMLNRFISGFGSMPLAVYALGIQIEAVSWMTADGFSTAVTAFMGQNLGADQYDRIKNGYKESIKIFIVIGALASFLLIGFGKNLTGLFMEGDRQAIAEGGRLLGIMGISEIFMTVEIGTNGALNGLGLTKIPAVNGLVGNFLRIPISLLLMPKFGVVGIWMAISISMAIKGVVAVIAYEIARKKTDGFRKLSYRREYEATRKTE